MEDAYISAGLNVFAHVMEKATEFSVLYMKECKRNTLTKEDIEYGMKYVAMHIDDINMNSELPECLQDIMNDEEEEEEEEEEEGEEDEWSRYEGDNPICQAMNHSVDTWDDWVPDTPVECLLKKSIDRTGNV